MSRSKVKFLNKLKIPNIYNIEKLGVNSGIFSVWELPSPLDKEKPVLPTFVIGIRIKEKFFSSGSERKVARLIAIFD